MIFDIILLWVTLLNWYRSGQSVDTLMPILSTYLGHSCIRDTYWYLSACPELFDQALLNDSRSAGRHHHERLAQPARIDRAILYRAAYAQATRLSPHTLASYRDTFRLLLVFVQNHLGKAPSTLDLEDIGAPLVGAFLDDLEVRRSVSVRTRNLRLTAIRSFFRFVAYEEPALSAHIQRVLAVPSKRQDKKMVEFLVRPEIEALLKAPDLSKWIGRRDYTLLLLAIQTGLRISELISLDRSSVTLGIGAHVHCIGKGRKERCTPITRYVSDTMRTWLAEPSTGQ